MIKGLWMQMPSGIESGQTWADKHSSGNEGDCIKITTVLSNEHIGIETESGLRFQTDEKYLKNNFDLKTQEPKREDK